MDWKPAGLYTESELGHTPRVVSPTSSVPLFAFSNSRAVADGEGGTVPRRFLRDRQWGLL